jgi:hypothetical protein
MKITSTITALDLKAMTHNGMSLWLTPGSEYPYWSVAPSWQYDFRLATPEDFLEAAGLMTAKAWKMTILLSWK